MSGDRTRKSSEESLVGLCAVRQCVIEQDAHAFGQVHLQQPVNLDRANASVVAVMRPSKD